MVVYVIEFATLFKLAITIPNYSVCVNPYHYERVVSSEIPQSLINVQSEDMDDPFSYSVEVNELNEYQLFDGIYDAFIQQQLRFLEKAKDQVHEGKKPENQDDQSK